MNEKTLNDPDKKHTWSTTIRHWLDRLCIYKKRLFISLWNDKKNLLLFALFVFIYALFEEYITDRARYYIMLLPMDYHLSLLSKILFLILMSAPLYFLLKAFENRYYVPPSLILGLAFLAYVYANITLGIVPPSYLTRAGDFIFSSICVLVLILARNFLSCGTIKEPKEKTLLIPDFAIEDEQDDKLDFLQGVKFLAGELEKISPQRSYSIGIVGAWGSGKSSYLNLLEQSLDRNKFIIVKFNPRHSLNACTIQEDFFHELFSTLKKYDSRFSNSFKEYLKAINIISENKFLSSFMSVHEVWNKEDEKNKINRALERLGKRVVVFTDDFDRLLREEIMEVLKLIDGNASFSNMIFITAYDKEHLNSLLDSVYKESSTPFSEKFFSAEIQLPFRPYSRILNYLMGEISGLSKKGENFNLKEKEQLEPLLSRTLPTFRHAKRFLNQFKWQYDVVKKEVLLKEYFLLHLIKYKWYQKYIKLKRHEYFKKDLFGIIEKGHPDFRGGHNKDLLEILCRLFTETPVSDVRSIKNSRAFDIYFQEAICDRRRVSDIHDILFQDNPNYKEVVELWIRDGHIQWLNEYLTESSTNFIQNKTIFHRYFRIILHICTLLEEKIADVLIQKVLCTENISEIYKRLDCTEREIKKILIEDLSDSAYLKIISKIRHWCRYNSGYPDHTPILEECDLFKIITTLAQQAMEKDRDYGTHEIIKLLKELEEVGFPLSEKEIRELKL